MKPLRYSNLAKGLSQTQRVRCRITQSLNTVPNESLMVLCITYLMNNKEVLTLASTGESKYVDHYITWNVIYGSQFTTTTPEPFALMTDCNRLHKQMQKLPNLICCMFINKYWFGLKKWSENSDSEQYRELNAKPQ